VAISGKFVGDFDDFNRAVASAETKLVSFEAGSSKVTSALERMETSLSGRKLIQDATLAAQAVENIGGVSKLTEAEVQRLGAQASAAADKMRAMGITVPPGIQNIADRARGAAEDTLRLGASATTTTGNFESMLGMASGLAGALGIAFSIGAAVNFGREILADADALVKLHDKSNISVEGLQAMRIAGDDAGVSLEDMVASVNMLQKRLGGDNDSANKALLDLGINIEAFKQLDGAQQMILISDAVRGIEDPLRVANDLSALFGKSWAEQLPVLKRGFKELSDGTTLMSADTVHALDDVGDALTRASRTAKGEAAEAFAFMFLGWSQAARDAKRDAEEIESAIKKMTATAQAASPGFGALVPPKLPKDLDDIIAKSNSLKAGIDADVEAFKKWNAAGAEMTGSMTGWQTTLDTMDGAVVEAIKVYLSAGVSQGTLATAYGLTAQQIKAVVIALEEEAAAMANTADFEKAAGDRRLEITRAMTKATNDLVLADLNRKQMEGEASDKFLAGALADAQAQDALNQVVGQLPPEIAKIPTALEASQSAFAAFKGVVVAGTGEMINSLSQFSAASTWVQDRVTRLDAQRARGGFFIDTGASGQMPVQTRDSGGPVTAGTSYLIGGGNAPELFTPGASGFVTPGGGGGSVVVQNVFHLVDTEANLARRVSEQILRSVKQGQQLAAFGK
jgi:hypothetical protein